MRNGLHHTLAHTRTPFVNRERELDVLAGFLSRASACRLVTLFGPVGSGKTRLALRAADLARQAYPDGVFVVVLASLAAEAAAPDLLLTATADALGLAFRGRADPKDQLLNYCREKRLLLVLDDLEHVLGKGPSAGELLVDLQRTAPEVVVLATSRRPLGIEGECTWPIGGMLNPPEDAAAGSPASEDQPYPGASSDATDYGALRLLLESVQRSRLPLPLSAEERAAAVRICRLVEGMPLGLEMASAWAQSIPLAEIQAGLERVLSKGQEAAANAAQKNTDSQAPLRAAFEYSWEQLSASEQRVLAQLSVFPGEFGHLAGEQVAGASSFMLAALVEKSLLRAHPLGRFDMHEWVRELAAAKLAQIPGAYEEARECHCATYSQMLTQLERDLRGAGQARALDKIAGDVGNVRAAWRWAVDHGCTHELLLALEGLHLYYYHRGWVQEGQAAFAAALAALHAEQNPWLYARLLVRAGRFSGRLGLYSQAKDQLGEGLELCGRLRGEVAQEDVQREQAMARLVLSAVLRGEGDGDGARQAAQQGLDLYRACGDASGVAHALGILGMLRGSSGQVEEAQAQLDQALALYRELGDPYGQASVLNDLGNIAAGSGRLDEARVHYDRCLLLRRQIGDLWGSSILLNNLGYLAHLSGTHTEAVEYLDQGLAIQREIGDRYHIANCLSNLGAAHRALGQCQLAARYLCEGLELAHEIGARPLVLELSAEVGALLSEREQSDRERAAELLVFVCHHPLTDKWTAQRAQVALTELTPSLAPEAWTAAQERAQSDTLEAVVHLVLDNECLPQAA
jgi:predicted ATPase/Tfp pilus assembly protein PilF